MVRDANSSFIVGTSLFILSTLVAYLMFITIEVLTFRYDLGVNGQGQPFLADDANSSSSSDGESSHLVQ